VENEPDAVAFPRILSTDGKLPPTDSTFLPTDELRLIPANSLNLKLFAMKHPLKGVRLNFKDGFEVWQRIKQIKKSVKGFTSGNLVGQVVATMPAPSVIDFLRALKEQQCEQQHAFSPSHSGGDLGRFRQPFVIPSGESRVPLTAMRNISEPDAFCLISAESNSAPSTFHIPIGQTIKSGKGNAGVSPSIRVNGIPFRLRVLADNAFALSLPIHDRFIAFIVGEFARQQVIGSAVISDAGFVGFNLNDEMARVEGESSDDTKTTLKSLHDLDDNAHGIDAQALYCLNFSNFVNPTRLSR
jgi:hypothetical protein